MNEKSVFKWLSCRTKGCKFRKADATGKLEASCPRCGSVLVLSRIWHYRLTEGGKTTVTPGFASRKDTIAALIAAKEATRKGILLPGKEKPVQWEFASEKVAKEIEKSNLRPNSKSAYLNYIKNLNKFFTGSMQNFSVLMCKEYIELREEAGVAPRTISEEITMLRRIFAETCQWYPVNTLLADAKPMLHAVANTLQYVKVRASENKKTRILSLWEIDFLLSMCDQPRLKLIIQLALSKGLRKENIIELRYDQIDFIKMKLAYEIAEMKSKRQFLKELDADSIALIVDWRKTQKPSKHVFASAVNPHTHIESFYKSWWKLLDRCNEELKRLKRPTFEDVCFHTLRHTYATMEYIRCRDLKKVSHEMDHTDSKTTEIYLHLAAFYSGDDPALYHIKFHKPARGQFTPSIHSESVDGTQETHKCDTLNDTSDLQPAVCNML